MNAENQEKSDYTVVRDTPSLVIDNFDMLKFAFSFLFLWTSRSQDLIAAAPKASQIGMEPWC